MSQQKKLPPIPAHLRPRVTTTPDGDMVITIPAWDSTGHTFTPTPAMRDRIMALVRGFTGPAIRVLQRIETYADGSAKATLTTPEVAEGHQPVVVDEETQERERDIDRHFTGLTAEFTGGEPDWDLVDPGSDAWKEKYDSTELECLMVTYREWSKQHPEDVERAESRCAAIEDYIGKDGKKEHGQFDSYHPWMTSLEEQEFDNDQPHIEYTADDDVLKNL